VAQVAGESAIVIRGRDGVIRAFHNVCKHRGSQLLEEPSGSAVRFQCPYHAWVYDLDGSLIRAKHTDGLEAFDVASYGLTAMDVEVADGQILVRPVPDRLVEKPAGLLTADELDAVRRPYLAASLLPGRSYHDPEVFAFEQERWFGRDWVCAGRAEEAPDTGGAAAVETWQGIVFTTAGGDRGVPPLAEWLGDLVPHVERFDFAALRRGHRIEYDVAANWKLIVENYSECYHCPGLHPQLNRLTPYDVGADYETQGAWQGGWMELRDGFETMALEGAHRIGPPMCGVTPTDERRIDYLVVWPNLLLSVHPDYLLMHRLEPLGPARTRVICDWLFEPATMAVPGFDPGPAIEFWDLTNRQDWHACELQQRGTASGAFRAGRFANNEPSVHAFDAMCADRYLGDAFVTGRTIRDDYRLSPTR
jgi:phenylpropionate dioxygenase-like ring-hydroxylating dioxygenase large terminal subunit